jgi:hypothetical protein
LALSRAVLFLLFVGLHALAPLGNAAPVEPKDDLNFDGILDMHDVSTFIEVLIDLDT